jgi:hypothetical protein
MSGFGVTTLLPKGSYVLKVEEYEWILCITLWVTILPRRLIC